MTFPSCPRGEETSAAWPREARLCAEMGRRADIARFSSEAEGLEAVSPSAVDVLALRRFRRQVRRLLTELSA